MDSKEVKVSESIKIIREASTSHREYSETYRSESKSISEYEYEEFTTAGYCSGTYDDEVFLDSEDPAGLKNVNVTKPRERRTSDVIDSVGDTPPKSNFFPVDFLDVEKIKMQSLPTTPGSDMGYFSNCGLSTPPSLLDFKPVWSRLGSFNLDGPSIEEKNFDSRHYDQTDAGDESDAKPNRDPSYVSPPNTEGKMPTERDSSEYNMNHANRGYAYIFNHDTFSNGMPDRKGSSVDVDLLIATYEMLGFKVETFHNLDFARMQATLQHIVKEDYTDCDCVSVSVLTHGQEPNLLYSSDYIYSVESLWQAFTADKCPTLAGKPKLFFIQACRGNKLDPGVRLVRNRTETDSGSASYKIPKMADFLIAFSTVEGYYSWRNPDNGTWFVQSLCQVLREHHKEKDLLNMMTIVNRKVAIEFESYNDIHLEQHEKKQVPSISHTLLRDVYLRPKN